MKHIVLIREEYTRDLEVYNRPNEPDTLEAGWEAGLWPRLPGNLFWNRRRGYQGCCR